MTLRRLKSAGWSEKLLPVTDAAGPAWPSLDARGLDARVHGLGVQRIAAARQFRPRRRPRLLNMHLRGVWLLLSWRDPSRPHNGRSVDLRFRHIALRIGAGFHRHR